METVKQPRGNNFDPAVNGAEAIEYGAYGELMRRAKERPLCFSFVWRGGNFKGSVECVGEGMRLTLQSDLGVIPFSAENAGKRSGLLAVVDTCADSVEASLKIVQGQTIILEHEIVLPRSENDTVATIISQLTVLVLNTAPYLDLIAEVTPAQSAA